MKSPQTEFSGRGREQILYKVELRASPSFRGHFGCSDGAGREWQLSDQIIEQ